MRRREFLGAIGAATAWPFAARAQQPAMQTIGFLNAGAPPSRLITSFRQNLAEAGHVEGRNLTTVYRFAEGKYDLLPGVAAELVQRQVAVIVASPSPAALAAKTATSSVPIVFNVPDDPIKLGLVAAFSRPGGNATGGSFLLSELGAKQLGLLHELVPGAKRVGFLVNPGNENAGVITSDLRTAAAMLGVEINVVQATDSREIEAAFAALLRGKVQGLVVGTDPLFFARRVQLATLASRHALPTVYNARDYAEAGGLMSYGTNLFDAYRQMAAYTARILKGEKPADLPVVQSTKFEFIINLPTARALDLIIPPTLLARADEVIE